MELFTAKLTGLSPIMFHNERLVDPGNHYTQELKKLTSQRAKTDELLEEIKWLEWRAGFYEHDGRPVVPADNVLATGLQGARKRKLGKHFEAGVFEKEPHFFLDYEGPKKIDKLKDPRWLDYRSVVVSRRRVMRARPIFRNWGVTIALYFDPEIIELSQLQEAFQIAGERIGMCERRPRLGRFAVEAIKAKGSKAA